MRIITVDLLFKMKFISGINMVIKVDNNTLHLVD